MDFRNFTYQPGCADMEASGEPTVPVRAVNGRAEADGVFLTIDDVVYGDLDGDGRDEAVIRTLCEMGGTGRFDEGFVYTMRDGKPVLAGRIQGGDRASGGVRCARVEGGSLQVERVGNESGAAAGIDFVDTETWKLQGGRLAQAGKPVRRVLHRESARPLRFPKGASSTVVHGRTAAIDSYLVRAREGQTMTVSITAKGGDAAFDIMIDDYTVTCRTGRWSGVLPGGGAYNLWVIATRGTPQYDLSVAIR